MRQPKNPPLPCWGLEFEKHDPKCQACPHQQDCRKASPSWMSKTPLDKVIFDITPAELKKGTPEQDVLWQWEACYEQVFGTSCRQSLKREDIGKIMAQARLANCPVRQFILTLFLIHHQCHPGEPFYVNQCLGAAAQTTLANWGKALHEKYHTGWREEDIFNLLQAGGDGGGDSNAVAWRRQAKPDPVPQQLLDSDRLFAGAVVDREIRCPSLPMEELWQKIEPALSPTWLAMEEGYLNAVLRPYIKKRPYISPALHRHRQEIVKAFTKLHSRKGNYAAARYYFTLREQHLPWVVSQLNLGAAVKDFRVKEPLVTDITGLWQSVGRAAGQLQTWQSLGSKKRSNRKAAAL